MLAGPTSQVIIRSGGDVSVLGWDGDRIQAESDSPAGLKVERANEKQFARLRAKVGDHVLVDWRMKQPNLGKKKLPNDAIEVEIGGNGKVSVPFGSTVQVYSGGAAHVQDVRGHVTIYAGANVLVRNVQTLVHISAGGAIDFECEGVEGIEAKFKAGRDLRCYIRGLTDATVFVDDLGGDWMGVVGNGSNRLRLSAGGDAILVTNLEVKPQPPNYVIGMIEKPGASVIEGNRDKLS